jgi:deoxyribonuclease V
MNFPNLHSWPINPKEAIELQRSLADRVFLELPHRFELNTVAGVDISSIRGSCTSWAAVVVWDIHTHNIIEEITLEAEITFPYIPGLLSFREIPAILQAFERITNVPDVILCDGQGLAHPRFFGLACHLGLWLDLPTIGCAKTRLVGEVIEPDHLSGSSSSLNYRGKEVGSILRTKKSTRPLFISPGHLIDSKSSSNIVLKCCRGLRLPEPIRLAHQAANRNRKANARIK